MKDIRTIREAVIANRGGFEEASDGEIMTLWQHLPAETQGKYLESVKTAPKGRKGAGDAENM